MPAWLATVWPKITPWAEDRRIACSSSSINAARAFALDKAGFMS